MGNVSMKEQMITWRTGQQGIQPVITLFPPCISGTKSGFTEKTYN